jgi:hypothetical protein
MDGQRHLVGDGMDRVLEELELDRVSDRFRHAVPPAIPLFAPVFIAAAGLSSGQHSVAVRHVAIALFRPRLHHTCHKADA